MTKKLFGIIIILILVIRIQVQGSTFINVTNYGVIGDGTNDDYPGLLAADQALPAAGGELYFPPNLKCRVATAGVNGLTISNQSNITILMDSNTVLVMDNMVDGLAVSHGILVEGPCTNITMIGVHVKYASMATTRQGYAPIYFLGANISNGTYFERGSTNGTENPAGIDAGAIRNVVLQNVTVENSPSVMVGIVGVNGITINNFNGTNSWADGLYHVNFCRSHINGANLINCGDDAISLAAYESDPANANINNAYHGEGTVIANVNINGYWPTNGGTVMPAGSLVFLGVRDVEASGVIVNNRYRGLRFETGPENYNGNPDYNFTFLANQDVNIADVAITNCTEVLAICNDGITTNDDPKWWQSNVHISHVTAVGGNITADIYGENGGDSPLMDGYFIRDFACSGYAEPYGTFQNFINCKFIDMKFDGAINFNGFVPYQGDPCATNGSGAALYPDQDSSILNLQCQSVSFLGLKGCYLDGIVSSQAPQTGITLTSCGNVQFGSLSVTNANRTAWPYACGISLDSYDKGITGQVINFNQDNQSLPSAVSINTTNNNSIAQIVVNTGLNTASDLVYDQSYSSGGPSQISQIHWYDGGYTNSPPAWQSQIFP
jgi:hypothetical protein